MRPARLTILRLFPFPPHGGAIAAGMLFLFGLLWLCPQAAWAQDVPVLGIELSESLEDGSSLERSFLLRETQVRLPQRNVTESLPPDAPSPLLIRIRRPEATGPALIELLDNQGLVLRARPFHLSGTPDDNIDVARIIAELVHQNDPPPAEPSQTPLSPTPPPLPQQPPLPNAYPKEKSHLHWLARGGGGYADGGIDGFGQVGTAIEIRLPNNLLLGVSADYETPYILKINGTRFSHQVVLPGVALGYTHPLRSWLDLRTSLFAQDRVVRVEYSHANGSRIVRWNQNLAGGLSLGVGFHIGSLLLTADANANMATRQIHTLDGRDALDTGLFRVYGLFGIGYDFSL